MIELIDLKKSFDDKWVHKGISLVIPKGQMTVIIGRSGQGKSVLLKEIIGLIKPSSGKVLVDNVDITKLTGRALQNMFKKFGYVFQFAALLDSLTILENIAITLLENRKSLKEAEPIVKEKLALVDLPTNITNKYPSELSGGMRKRVGLARTLITNPEIILYDEPTTGLDPITSRIIHELMFNMQQKLNITSVVVSHDVEIFNYADNVALLDDGKIRYYGQAKEVWQSNNPYIYQFVRGLPEGPIKTEVKS
ncbi:ABC transporter ATP-binding protein [candidate division TM6 bacterium RIFCSPHIGHO2_12_FULL_32_22]|nr:MAG: ABC transporter ATP-binding protein [candidate division TM6 bacterium RIFCSPHIGHO2_12_FULL_32_22]